MSRAALARATSLLLVGAGVLTVQVLVPGAASAAAWGAAGDVGIMGTDGTSSRPAVVSTGGAVASVDALPATVRVRGGALAPDGNLYVQDAASSVTRLLRVAPSGTVTTVASSVLMLPGAPTTGDVEVLPDGDLVVAGYRNPTTAYARVDADTGAVTQIWSDGSGISGARAGVDAQGSIYFVGTIANPAGVWRLASTAGATPQRLFDAAAGTYDLAADADGNIYLHTTSGLGSSLSGNVVKYVRQGSTYSPGSVIAQTAAGAPSSIGGITVGAGGLLAFIRHDGAGNAVLYRSTTSGGAVTATNISVPGLNLDKLTSLPQAGAPADVPFPDPVDASISGTVRVGSVLTADAGTYSPADASIDRAWKVGSATVATAGSYTPVLADAGSVLTVTVTGRKTGYVDSVATSTGAVVETVRGFTGDLVAGRTLTADDPSGTSTWTLSSSSSCASPATTTTGATFRLPISSTGSYVRLSQTVDGRTGDGSCVGPVGQPSLAADATPVISGVARVGGALTAIAGGYDVDPDALSYRWKVAGTAVGTDSPVYRPTAADVDKTVTVTITATRTGYVDAVTTSAATGPVTAGGRVTAWGSNFQGESTVPSSLARKTVTAIAAGFSHTLALTTDGKVTAWGAGIQATVPTSVAAQTISAIASGTNHNLVLTTDGRVLAWGNNINGQATVPASLDGRTVIAIAAGDAHSLALTSDGQVTAWGSDSDGQATIPAALSGKFVVAIAAGSIHSLALTSDGQVVVWGRNSHGQSTVPATLDGRTVIAIAGGTVHSVALTADGKVTAWGGDTTSNQAVVPASLATRTVVAIATGPGSNHTLALTSDRQIVGWGRNANTALTIPTALNGQPNTAIAAGGSHSLALTTAMIANRAPSISGTPAVGRTLSADLGDYNAAADAIAVQWYADGAAIEGATALDHTVTAAQRGTTITVAVTATKAGYAAATDQSVGLGPVGPGAFTTGPDAAITGSAVVGATLTATPGPTQLGSTSPAADSFTYAWAADGIAVAGATSRTLVLTPDLAGTRLTVAVTALSDGYDAVTDVSEPVGPVAKATFATGPTASITGTPVVDGTLTATPGGTTPAADSYSYRWFADGAPVPDADGDELSLTAALVGKHVTVQVTAVRDGYTDATDTSPATAAVARATFTTGPTATITGTPVVDGRLTAGPADLTATTPSATGFTYAWAADGEPVDGATSRTLDLTPELLGTSITVSVTAVRDGYTGATDTSDPTSPVAPATFATRPRVSLTGTAVVDGVLQASVVAPTPAAQSYAYAWYADGTRVTGADRDRLVLSPDQVGTRITLEVTATRAGYDDATVASAASEAVTRAAFTTAPSAAVSGTAQVGQVLTATAGPTTPAATGYRFAWYADETPVPAAHGATLLLAPEHRGHRISVVVTASRPGYGDAATRSSSTAPVVTDRAPAVRLTIEVPAGSREASTTPDGQPTVRRGRTATLTWTSEGATSLSATGPMQQLLDDEFGDSPVPANGSVEVRFDRTGLHTFRMTASNERGSTSTSASLVAVRAPARLTVRAPGRARAGATIRLRVRGLGYHERYVVSVAGQRVSGTRARADASTVVRTVTLPRSLDPGKVRIRVVGRSTQRSGTAVVRIR